MALLITVAQPLPQATGEWLLHGRHKIKPNWLKSWIVGERVTRSRRLSCQNPQKKSCSPASQSLKGRQFGSASGSNLK
jgi:hypothetical protein